MKSDNIWNIYNNIENSFTSQNESKNINSLIQCINCKSNNLSNYTENIICEACGCSNGRIIDNKQEWRNYGYKDNRNVSDPSRCGFPINLLTPNSSLSTIILSKSYNKYARLNTWNGISYKERSLINISNNITRIARRGNIPICITDKAISMYKMLSSKKIKRGTSRQSIIAACILYAMKDKKMCRNNVNIASLFDLKKKKLSKGCNQFNQLMYAFNSDYFHKMIPQILQILLKILELS